MLTVKHALAQAAWKIEGVALRVALRVDDRRGWRAVPITCNCRRVPDCDCRGTR